ncbi:MAG TPA: leucyl/phenylalanyl-tRNA--protein transferase [Planctomycetes bacterium]|nr:leucyl/phenylalanyl-tRNA--protein transferase [Planctomycetota bacterium]
MTSIDPSYLDPSLPPHFPDPRFASEEGLLAFGGLLEPSWLLLAYAQGIFPWFGDGDPILWWSPDPRCVLDLEDLHVPRRLARRARSPNLCLTWNQAFAEVLLGCNEDRPDGIWITPAMRRAYQRLHELGHAHSLEVWEGEKLVGGIYGVQVGGFFAGESMFHRVRDASKIALVALRRSLGAAGIQLFDVQFLTPHLERFGAKEIPRERYLERLVQAREAQVDLRGLEPCFNPEV